MLPLHMAEAHEIPENDFPGPCPLCLARGEEIAPHMATVLTLKRPGSAVRVRDFEVAVRQQ